jgi:subtilisin-like proprotein convertase family protein
MNWQGKILTLGLGGLIALGALAGCGEDVNNATDDGEVKELSGGKFDRWGSIDSPTRFRSEINYKWEELPSEGYSQRVAWADTYWPTYENSILARWQGEGTLSPVEKYDKAFNDWSEPEGFAELQPYDTSTCEWDQEYYDSLGPASTYVSNEQGNLRARNGVDDDGDGLADAEECGYGDKEKDYDGVETWWGLCHAWVPAAMLEDEPLRPVEHNGVTFEVSDLKALMISQYDRSNAYMLGGRCNLKEVERDEETGKVLNDECNDVNAGSFHLIVTNFLGLQQRAIAEDRTFDYEVWNQPVIGYKITEQSEISMDEAHALLGVEEEGLDTYHFNEDAVRFVEVRMTTDYVTESHASTEPNSDTIERWTRNDRYHYVLELDGEGKIIGGEWAPESRENHPDFLWLPTRPSSYGNNPNISLDQIRELVAKSRQEPGSDDSDDVNPDDMSLENTERAEIPDNDPEGVVSTISVMDNASVNGVKVGLDIDHTYKGDLVVELRHKDVTALVYNGKNADKPWTDDVSIDAKAIEGFGGMNAKGDWELVVTDNAGRDTGALTNWSLDIDVAGEAPEPDADEPGAGDLVEVSSTDIVEIPDNDEEGVTSTLNVGENFNIDSMTVDVDVEHSYKGDLVIELLRGETVVTVFNGDDVDNPGADDVNIVGQEVSEFNGQFAQGDWTLRVTDRANLDQGSIKTWKLTFVRAN